MNLHLALHCIIPMIVAVFFFRRQWKSAFGIMILTLLVDMDHLLADPIYDPGRCSIGFHPLHGFIPIVFYLFLCFIPKTRLVGIGLVIHMALDSIDCRVIGGVWFT